MRSAVGVALGVAVVLAECKLHRSLLYRAQVQFAGAEIRQGFDAEETVWAGFPERRQLRCGEFFEDVFELVIRNCVQHYDALAFFLIGNCGDNKLLFG